MDEQENSQNIEEGVEKPKNTKFFMPNDIKVMILEKIREHGSDLFCAVTAVNSVDRQRDNWVKVLNFCKNIKAI